jgi:Protein of unknown function (DUF1838)
VNPRVQHRRAALVVLWATFSAGCASALDLSTPEGKMLGLVKMRASSDGKDAYADWQVTAWAVVPGARPTALFRLDGFNVGRMERQSDGGWRFISREVAYYRDRVTGAILTHWDNPFTKQRNEVLQVINDPVNIAFDPPTKPGVRLPPLAVRGENVSLVLDVPLAYPNPLTPRDYPLESSGEMYLASEHFLYFAKTADVANDALASAPTHYGWLRNGPWLPWMKMGQMPGHIAYVGHGRKLASAAELDPVVREYTEKHHPEFMKSPAAWSQPNETSWTYYRKMRPPSAAASAPAK